MLAQVLASIDSTAVAGLFAGAVAIIIGLWKGGPEISKALAERDQLVATTYRELVGDIRTEVANLRKDVAEARIEVAKLEQERDALRREVEHRDARISALEDEVKELRREVADLRSSR